MGVSSGGRHSTDSDGPNPGETGMRVGVVTVGDELLAGDIENTNATWLASSLAERGATVRQIGVVPDEQDVLVPEVRRFVDNFDAVVVTGGVGATPDDVTVEAVARVFDHNLVVHDEALADVRETVSDLRDRLPDIDVDEEAATTLPAGARYLPNPEGLSPGCVVANVYVFPGIPEEMRAMFGLVADEFAGDRRSQSFYTTTPESNLAELLERVRAEHAVAVGSYPDRDAGANRIKVTATDRDALEAACERLRASIDVVEFDGTATE